VEPPSASGSHLAIRSFTRFLEMRHDPSGI
jgi:hypothetical protein